MPKKMPASQQFRLSRSASQQSLGKRDAVRLPKIHPNLFLSSHQAAERVIGSNVSKVCVAGRPVSDYMRNHHAEHHGNPETQHDLAATQSYIVASDTLLMDQPKFDKIFKLGAEYIEQSIHDRLTLVHCWAGINRSTTSILTWWIMFGDRGGGRGGGRGCGSGSDNSDLSDDSDYSDTDDDDDGDDDGEGGNFSDWTQVRDYIRRMNTRYRGTPALTNPRFEQLLHGFCRTHGRRARDGR
jgi:hypothetical protein